MFWERTKEENEMKREKHPELIAERIAR